MACGNCGNRMEWDGRWDKGHYYKCRKCGKRIKVKMW